MPSLSYAWSLDKSHIIAWAVNRCKSRGDSRQEVCVCVAIRKAGRNERFDERRGRVCVLHVRVCVLREDRQNGTNVSKREGGKKFNGGGKEGVCVVCVLKKVCVGVTSRQKCQVYHTRGRWTRAIS